MGRSERLAQDRLDRPLSAADWRGLLGVGEVLDALGTTTHNTEDLKDWLKALASTPVKWSVLA